MFIEELTTSTGDAMKPLVGVKMNDALSYKIELEKKGHFPKQVTFNHSISKPGIVRVNTVLVGSLSDG